MANLDLLLDDALAGFDDDDGALQQPSAGPSTRQQPSPSSSSSPAPAPSQPRPAAAAAAPPARMQFDPLKRNSKASSKGGRGGGSSSSNSSRPALTPEVNKLQEDLAALMSEWSQAIHPEGAAPPAAGQQQQQQQRSGASVLQALQEQTQRTVEQQARARPPPAAATAGSEDPQQMSAIVDVVMQHLLSKDVLYQPMKEIAEKYPPWLERQAAAGASSSLSAADLDRYRQQYACITRLCDAYEAEPGNTAKIMGLLQEMQACGEPPEDIVADMTNTIAADLPNLAGGGAGGGLGDLNFDDLDLGGLGDVPDLKNCPVQ